MNKPGDGMGRETAVERLPFQVRIATRAELEDVVRLRSTAYGRHLPEMGQRLAQPEAADFELGCEVFVAVSKLDGSLLGTLRTHANALEPLPLEASLALPERFANHRLVEATRLSIQAGTTASLVRNALFKAFYQYCVSQHIDWMVLTGRRPIDRIYDGLLFTDVGETGAYHPMAHIGGVPHRVMSLSVSEADAIWSKAQHPLYEFTVKTWHPDIDLSGARDLSSAWSGEHAARSSSSVARRMQALLPLQFKAA